MSALDDFVLFFKNIFGSYNNNQEHWKGEVHPCKTLHSVENKENFKHAFTMQQISASQESENQTLTSKQFPEDTSDKKPLNLATEERSIPLSELQQHRSKKSAWISLNGNVYDITQYAKLHPGGSSILYAKGTQCMGLFNKYHSWVNWKQIMEPYKVGRLVSQ